MTELAHEDDPTWFSAVGVCTNCHVGIGVQYYQSMHSKSLSNPVFRAHYYKKYLPEFHDDPDLYELEPPCLRCHGPVAYLKTFQHAKQRSEKGAMTDCKTCHGESGIEQMLEAPGVICDICHRIEGFEGDAPGNGNYIAKPGRLKFGPFKYEADFHRQYSELQTRGEFCGICHNSRNRYGAVVRSTYDEWKASSYAARGVQCQDCHMSAKGFQTAGKSTYESGRAAYMTVGEAPDRDKLYTHRFFGAHSRSQIEEALGVEIVLPSSASRGEEIEVKVRVNNAKTGHAMPTGSVELRTVWLEVAVNSQSEYGSDYEFEMRLAGDRTGYGVAGASDADERVFKDVVPDGVRLYRAVFLDEDGKQTFYSHDAKERVFDNRLAAAEVREELYTLSIPEEADGWVSVEATLYYLRFPPAFASALELRPALPVEFARGTAELLVSD